MSIDNIVAILKDAASLGQVFLSTSGLFHEVLKQYELSGIAFQQLLLQAAASGAIVLDGDHVYLTSLKAAEVCVADFIRNVMAHPQFPLPMASSDMRCCGWPLSPEQRTAVRMAHSSKLSMIIGGAGTGKSTLVSAILQSAPDPSCVLLCAPTGKAAQNLTAQTGYPASTVHSALGVSVNGDFMHPCSLTGTQLIVVDEASMLTLEMMAGIICAAPPDCKIVLIGDWNQLPAVGPGNILSDLYQLGVPCTCLSTVYRQPDKRSALYYNVTHFPEMPDTSALQWDSSFDFLPVAENDIAGLTRDIARFCYQARTSTIVLSPFAEKTDMSVNALNESMQRSLALPGAPALEGVNQMRFYENDRVMFIRNNKNGNYINGELGNLEVVPYTCPEAAWEVRLENRTVPITPESLRDLRLAYAMSIHKSQGSSFDTVILPLSMKFSCMLNRNLLYTALTRARKQVLLIGDIHALEYAMRRPPASRNSGLVQEVQRQQIMLAS